MCMHIPRFEDRPLSFYNGSSIGDIVVSVENGQSYVGNHVSCAVLSKNLLLYRYGSRNDVSDLIAICRRMSTSVKDYCYMLAKLDLYLKSEDA